MYTTLSCTYTILLYVFKIFLVEMNSFRIIKINTLYKSTSTVYKRLQNINKAPKSMQNNNVIGTYI